MAAGALFLAFNVAPTEEMLLIAYHDVALAAARCSSWSRSCCSTLFVYGVGFAGQEERPEGVGIARAPSCAFTIAGYGIALAGQPLRAVDVRPDRRHRDRARSRSTMAVLAFPAALGAAIARLVV